MADSSSSVKKFKSLSKKFNLALVIMYLCSIIIAAPSVYVFTKKQIYDRANEDLNLLVDVVKSIQGYVANDLRPYFLEKKIFYSPAFSGIVATSRIAGHLKAFQPDYLIRNASDNPLNPDNQAKDLEKDLLQQFRASRTTQGLNTEGKINGKQYLVSAAPKISNKKGCLKCHGDPAKAPEDVTQSYGTGSGYGYRMGDIVGVSLVGVPLVDVQSLTVERSLYVIGIITVIFAILFMILNSIVKRLIISPIDEMTEVAEAVSKGDLNRSISSVTRNDEIGELAHSFELMRRSLVAAMRHMRKKG